LGTVKDKIFASFSNRENSSSGKQVQVTVNNVPFISSTFSW